MKTLSKLFKQDRERFAVPRSVQDVIPIKTIWDDGIFMLGAGKFSKTFRFEDINYAVASKEDKEAMFLAYSELLNSFDSGATYKITIVVKKLDKEEFKEAILIPLKGDALDVYRTEYNKILLDEATGANGFIQMKYITVSVFKKSIEEARSYFARVGEESSYRWSAQEAMRKGHSFKDFICPDTFEFEKDHFQMGGKYGRVVFLRDYANFIKDSMVSELCDFNRNMILCNKRNLLNANGFRLGVPGSGKSFGAKEEIAFIAIATDDDILVCDPEGEYGIIEALGGEVIRIAAGSPDHINAMDMVEGYGDSGNPIIEKSEFILSLFEQLDRNHSLSVIEKGIIDNCVKNVYEDYQNGGPTPTLCVLQDELRKHRDKEAEGLAKSLELFTNGSLNVFAHPTNVNTQSRMVVYDILNLGSQLKTMGLLVITDAMINRVSENWKKGKRTHLYIDEFHVVFENNYSSNFFASAWRRFRKRNAYLTGITQNAEYLLESVTARTMLSNSEFIVMNNQSASDRTELARLLNISEQQLSYVTDAEAGCGLMRIGNAIVPFVNRFNTNTALYRLMTTKPGETS
jgi:type IV secretory pathway VirB4 component